MSLESLEPRQLLAVTPSLSGSEVSFTSSGEDVHVRTNSAVFEWSSDGVNFSSDLDGDGVGADLRTDTGQAITISAPGNSLAAPFSKDVGSVVLHDTWVVGADLTVGAINIEVNVGATVSTRAVVADLENGASIADSGLLSLDGVDITLHSGSSLLAHVEQGSSFAEGSITLEAAFSAAEAATIPFVDLTDADSNITLTDADIRGGVVTITATSNSADLFDESGETRGIAGALQGAASAVLDAINSLSVIAGVAVSTADAHITMSGGSIDAESLEMKSDATTAANVRTATVYLATSFGKSAPHATVSIEGGATISTAGFVDVGAHADSTLSVTSTQAPLGVSTSSEKYNLTVAIGVSDIQSEATLSSDSTITAGTKVDFTAEVDKDHEVDSKAEAYFDGTLAIALGINVDHTTANALVDGDVTAGTNLTIGATVTTEDYKVEAESGVGIGSSLGEKLGNKLAKAAANKFLTNFYEGVLNKIGIRGKNQIAGQSSNQKWGLGASFAWNEITNDVTSRIGPGAAIDVGGDLSINAGVTETPQSKTSSSVKSSASEHVHRETGLAGAVSVGFFTNTVDAYIGRQAVVTASDIAVHSSVQSPYEFRWFVNEDAKDPETYISKIKPDLGLTLAIFTNFAKSRSSGENVSVAGNIQISRFDNHSNAYIDEGAQVTATGDLSVVAVAENDSVNFGGPFTDSAVDPRGLLRGTATAGKGVGGTFQWYEVVNNVRAEIKQDAMVSALSALVFADNDVRNISIGVQGGNADEFGFSGVSTIISTINHATSRIDDSATVLTGSGQARIPQDYDTISDDENSLFSGVNVFGPLVQFVDESNDTVRTAVDDADNSIQLPYAHGLATGDSVVYSNGGGADIGGLTNHETYYTIVIDDYTIKLAGSYELATANDAENNAIPLTLDGTTGAAHVLFPGFDPTASGVVDADSNQIYLGFVFQFEDGQPVRYSNGGGTSIGDLQDGKEYFAYQDGDALQLGEFPTITFSQTPVNLSLDGVTGHGHSILPLPFTDLKVRDPYNVLDSNRDGNVSTLDDHIIGVGEEYYQTDLSLAVIAGDESEIFNGAGGVSVGRNVGVGQAMAFDLIHRTTEAFVGPQQVELTTANFAPGVGVDSGGNVILGYGHGFSTGDPLVYTGGGDHVISGLRDRQTYYARRVDGTTIQLARSPAEAAQTAGTFFDPGTSVDASLAVIDLGYTHRFQVGDRIVYSTNSGTPVDNLTDGETYFVIPISTTAIALTDSVDSALATFHTVFDPTESIDGSGRLVFPGEHGFTQGQTVLYGNGGGTSIGGLTSGKPYRVNVVDESHVTLIDPDTNAEVTLDGSLARGHFHTLQLGFDVTTAVVAPSDRIDGRVEQLNLGYQHDLITEDLVRYSSGGAAPISGLVDGGAYYAVVFEGHALSLAAGETDASKARLRFFIPADGTASIRDGSLRNLGGSPHFDTIELSVDHGYVTGDRVIYSADGGTAVGGLTDGQAYYVIVPTVGSAPSESEIQLAATEQDALNGIAIDLDISSLTDESYHYVRGDTLIELDASGTSGSHFIAPDFRKSIDNSSSSGTSHSIRLRLDPAGTMHNSHGVGRAFDPQASGVVNSSDNSISLGYAHGFSTGQTVSYTAGDGKPIGGLHQGTPYYVIRLSATTIQFAESHGEALSESPEVAKLDPTTATGANHAITAQFRPIPVVDGTADSIRVPLHGLRTGDSVVYDNGGGNSIAPLVAGNTYFAVVLDRDTLQLSETDPTATPDTFTVVDLQPGSATAYAHRLAREGLNSGRVQTGGPAYIVANNDGQIVSISLAAALVTKSRSGAKWSRSERQSDGQPAKTGAGVAGDVAFSIITDTTHVGIEDADFKVDVGDLTLRAFNDSQVVTAAGALAIATSAKKSTGIAGSFVQNNLANSTQALISGSTVTVADGDLMVDVDNTGQIIGVALGGAGVSGSLAVAGSILQNLVLVDTFARIIDNSDVQVSDPQARGAGHLSVTSHNANTITGVAGAVAIAYQNTEDAIGVGAAFAMNLITPLSFQQDNSILAGTLAVIQDSDVTADGQVDIDSRTENTVTSVAAGIAVAGSNVEAIAAAVSVSVVLTDMPTRSVIRRKKSARIAAGDGVALDARDTTNVLTVAGDVAISNESANGLAISFNKTHNTVEATIDDTTVSSSNGDVQVLAHSTLTIRTVAAGGSLGGNIGREGSFAFNWLDNDTSATVSTAAEVTADGSVLVAAGDATNVTTVAGSVVLAGFLGSLSGATLSAIGIASATLISNNEVEASLGDNVRVQADGNRAAIEGWSDVGVIASATSSDTVKNVAAAGVVELAGRSRGIAGSASVVVMNEDTKAHIGQSAVINAATSGESTLQDVVVHAEETTTFTGVAGAGDISLESSGVGAGVDVAVLTKRVEAWIGKGADVEAAGDVKVTAESREHAVSVAGTLAVGAGGTGIAGSVGVSVYDVTTKAYIDSDVKSCTEIAAGGSIVIASEERTVMTLVDGDVAGGKNGVGGAFGIPIVNKTTESYVADGAIVDALGLRSGITVNAGDFATFGGDTSHSNLVSSVDPGNSLIPTADDQGYFHNRNAEPNTISDFKGLAVTANNSNQFEIYTGGVAIATAGNAAQVSVGFNWLHDNTHAYIGSAAINQSTSPAPGADQSVLVTAGDDFFIRSMNLGGSFSADEIAVTPGVEIAAITMDTSAHIDSQALVSANKNVNVTAYNGEDIQSIGLAVAGSSTFLAGAGVLSISSINNTTKAFLADNVTVEAGGNVAVFAEDLTDVDLIAGGVSVSLSGAGGGSSGAISVIKKDTRAFIGENTVVDAKGLGFDNTFDILNGEDSDGTPVSASIRGIGVSAYSLEDVFGMAVGGAAGAAIGLAGALGWQQIDSDTSAYIDRNALINTATDNSNAAHIEQDVYVTAVNHVQAESLHGTLGLSGIAGIGATMDIGNIDNQTVAAILDDVGGDSQAQADTGVVNARQDVRAGANSLREVFAAAVAGGVGLTGGGAVALSFWNIGSSSDPTFDVNGEEQNPAAGLDGDSVTTVNDSTNIDAGYTGTGTQARGDNSGYVALHTTQATSGMDAFTDGFTRQLLFFGDEVDSETTAYIGSGATIKAGDDVDVIAHETSTATITGGAVGAGAVVGVGGGVAVFNLGSKASAHVGDNATVSAADDVTVQATANETSTINAAAGSGGAVAVVAEYAESDVSSVQSASVGSGAKITSADAVSIDASHSRDLHAFTGIAGVGIAGVAGFAGANVTAGGTVEAVVDENAELGVGDSGSIDSRLGSVHISASSMTSRASAGTTAVVLGGGLSVEAAAARSVVNPTVQAATLGGVEAYTTGNVDVLAHAETKVEADGAGVEIAGGLAGGSMRVSAEASPTLVATLGANNILDSGGDVTVLAEQALLNGTDKTATATGFGVAASLLIGVSGVTVNAKNATSAAASIGHDSVLTASGKVDVESDVDSSLDASAKGGGGAGIVSIGTNVATIDADSSSQALVADGVAVTADALRISATGTDTLNGVATNNRFSLGGTAHPNGPGSDIQYSTNAAIELDSTTRAYVADSTSNSSPTITVNSLTIASDHETRLSGSSKDIAVAFVAGIGGAQYSADLQSVVHSSIGDAVVVDAETIDITANNRSGSTGGAVEATSATGGVGANAQLRNEIDVHHFTGAGVGDGARINAGYTLTGLPSSITGGVNILAENDAGFLSTSKLGSAGILGSSNNAHAKVNLTDFNASVTVGDDATLKSTGEITLATLAGADVNASASATSSALFSGGSTVGVATVVAANTVDIGSGALVESEDDVNLLAGQTSVLEKVGDNIPVTNAFYLSSRADGFATAGNVSGSGVDAKSDVTQTNAITVHGGASVRAVSDAYLFTNSGVVLPEAAAQMKSIFGDGRSSHSATATDNRSVKIDGDIDVGLFNRRLLEFDADGNIVSAADPSVEVTTDSSFSLDEAVERRINTIIAESAWFSGTSFDSVFAQQRAFWSELVEGLGGTLDFLADRVEVSGVILPTASISDLFAASGNILVNAENLTGRGQLTAPTDTAIEITNASSLTLLLNQVEIPDRPGGQVRLNQQRIASTADITDINLNSNLDNRVNLTFAYSHDPSDTNATADTEPKIRIVNDPSAGQIPHANLVFDGAVSNRGGDVFIDSGDGSVLVNDSLTAGSLSISSGADFVFSDTDSNGDGFFHVGGDPFDLYSDIAGANEAADGLVSDTDTPRAGTTGSQTDGAGSTIVAGNVIIQAENLNINGVIQSGIPFHSVNIHDPDSTLLAATQALTSSYQTSQDTPRMTTLDGKYLDLVSGNSSSEHLGNAADNLALQWDAQEERLVLVGDIEVKGGFMQLSANKILNTTGGELRVLDGYGTIDIRNDTALELALSHLNVGSAADEASGIEGVIVLTEGSRRNEAAAGQSALITRYTRSGNQITVRDNTTVDTSGDPSNTTTTAGSRAQYTPSAGSRYQWVSSGAEGQIVVYALNDLSSSAAFDDIVKPENIVSQTPDGRSELSSAGTSATTDLGNVDNVYDYVFVTFDNGGTFYWLETITNVYNIFNHLTHSEYDERITYTERQLSTHTHSVKGDYPIDITFLGDQGGITVDSLGSVVIGGSVEARGSTVTINAGVDANGQVANSGATIESADSGGVLVADRFDLNAPAGIGTQGPVYLDQTHASPQSAVVAASNGEIHLSALARDLTISNIVSASTITLVAAGGDIWGDTKSNVEAHVRGDRVRLTAVGDVGTDSQFFHVDTGVQGGSTLTVSAGDDARLRETTGDLRLATVQASTVHVDVVGGRLLDATDLESAPRDEATIASLVTLWNDLGLVGDGADERKALILSETIALRNFEYGQYWTQRNELAPTDPSSYDFQFSDDVERRLLESGFTSDEINTLEQSATDRFLALNAVYGPGGSYVTVNDPTYDPDSFDPDFEYQPTRQEQDDLTSHIAFTEDGLLWNLSEGVLDRTDLTVTIESPNVIADEITLTASDSIGLLSSSVQTIDVPSGDFGQIADDASNSIKIALLSAEREDLAFFYNDGSSLIPWVDRDDGDGIVEADEFNVIQLSLSEDVDVAGLSSTRPLLGASASGGVVVGTTSDLAVNQISTADGNDVRAEVRLNAAGGIVNGATLGSANVTASDFIAESDTASIGASAKPFTIDLTGELTVHSAGDAHLVSVASEGVAESTVPLLVDFGFATPVGAIAQLGSPPAPRVLTFGPTGNYLRLINDGVPNNRNQLAFNRYFTGAANEISAQFDVRGSGTGDTADGFSLRYLPTSIYGTSGTSNIFAAEEPNIADTFAIAFDFYPGHLNELSVHWNGSVVKTVEIPRTAITMDSNEFFRVAATLRHVPGGASVTVAITPDVHGTPGTTIEWVDGLFIPGLRPYESRPEFAGRTGGSSMNIDLDNIHIVYSETTASPVNLASIQAGGRFALSTHGAVLDANDAVDSDGNQVTPVLNISASEIVLDADVVGLPSNPLEIKATSRFGGMIESAAYVTSDSDLSINELTSTTGTLNVTGGGNLSLGFIRNYGGIVNLISSGGSILDQAPDAPNLLVGEANLTVVQNGATIGTASNPIEVFRNASVHVNGPQIDPSLFAFLRTAALPVGLFDRGVTLPNGVIQTEDFNGDGYPDILTRGSDGLVRIELNNGDATFTELATWISSITLDTAAADLNNDSAADVVNLFLDENANAVLQVYHNRGDGSGQLELAQSLDTGINLDGLEASVFPDFEDVDGDGFKDALLVDPRTREIRIFVNNGAGILQFQNSFSYTPWFSGFDPRITFADLTGDGATELVLGPSLDTARLLTIVVNDGTGNFTEKAVFLEDAVIVADAVSSVRSFSIGDLDGDGLNDLLISRRSFYGCGNDAIGNLVFINQGFGVVPDGLTPAGTDASVIGQTRLLFRENVCDFVIAPGFTETAASVLVDLDLDDDLDVVLDRVTGENQVWLNNLNTDGTFTQTGQNLPASGAIAVDDLDGDVDQDLVIGNQVWLQATSARLTDGQSFTVYENRLADTPLYGVNVLSVSEGEFVTFTLDNVAGGGVDLTADYAIDGDTGQITVVDPTRLDYERFTTLQFHVSIHSSRGGSDSTTILGHIRDLDVPDRTNASMYYAGVSDDLTTFHVDETIDGVTGGIDVSSLAFDLELSHGDRITGYEITGGSARYEEFAIDAGGIVTYSGTELSYEGFADGAAYVDLFIQAFDTEGLTQGPGTVRIFINDIYEGPTFIPNDEGVTVDEGGIATKTSAFATPGTSAHTLSASIGSVSVNDDGTWTWSFEADDGPTESQSVTVTATEVGGLTASTSFHLEVFNVPPTITVPQDTITVAPGQTATLTGTYDDVPLDFVTLHLSHHPNYASTVTDHGDGTWTWSMVAPDVSTSPLEFSAEAVDDDFGAATVDFVVFVDGQSPVLSLDQGIVVVDEGGVALNSGSYSDFSAVTLSASVGSIVDHGDGTWAWQLASSDGPEQSQTVTVTATDIVGNQSATTFQLDVNNVVPSANLALSATTATEGSPIVLTISPTDPGDDAVSRIIIDWGDGEQDTLDLPNMSSYEVQHTFADGPANHTISVSLIDEDGTFQSSQELVVLNASPTISSLSVPTSGNEGTVIDLSATATDPAGSNDVLDFVWSLTAEDGSKTELLGADASFMPPVGAGGTYAVELTVTDDDGGTTSRQATLEVQGAPVAHAGGPYSVAEGGVAAIDAAFASDPNQDASTLTYLWDLDGDGIFGEVDEAAEYGDEVGIAPAFSAALLDGGTSWPISLRVMDDQGMSGESTATVNVENVAPVVEPQTFFIDEGEPNGSFVGQVEVVDFAADTLSHAITGGTGQAVFGVDSSTGVISLADSSQLNHSVTPSLTLDVTVTDDSGASTSATMTVHVEDVGSLEVQQFQIDDGAPQASNIDVLAIRFNEGTNLNGLINSDGIHAAIQLFDPHGVRINLDDGHVRFGYDTQMHLLTIDLTTDGADGTGRRSILTLDGPYELRLDTARIHEQDGSHQLLDTDGTDDGILRLTFRRLLADFNGDGTVDLTDRVLFLQRFGSSEGDTRYDADYDLNGDGLIDSTDFLIVWNRPRRPGNAETSSVKKPLS